MFFRDFYNLKKYIMRRIITIAAFVIAFLTANAQQPDYFTPSRRSALKMPATPIVVSDPYFSIWSPTDKLYESSTIHWSDAKKSVIGVLRVDGKNYRFLGKQPDKLIPYAEMAKAEGWETKYTFKTPQGDWTKEKYDDGSWQEGYGAFGDRNTEANKTKWSGDDADVYIRRHFNVSKIEKDAKIRIVYSHDDVFELYLNGEKIVDTGNTWLDDQVVELTPAQAAKLHEGDNVIAAHCHNTTGGAYADFGIYYTPANVSKFDAAAEQLSCDVLATSSYYTFKCGPVKLNVVFTAPQLIDDLDLLSTPINYISYKVTGLDKKKHDVQLLITTSPELAVNSSSQPTVSNTLSKGGMKYLKAGTIKQAYCATAADLICQDWGYVYLTQGASNQQLSLNSELEIENTFSATGNLPTSKEEVRAFKNVDMPALAFVDNLGSVDKKTSKSNFTLIGYDDVWSIMYLYELRKGYWAHDGKVTIFDAFNKLRNNYNDIMQRCRKLDETIYDDAFKAGGKEYAEICSGAYRQTISAHKLFTDNKGRLLFFSKENNSNGSVNTVDLTYPSAPLFLIYNPELEKGMMTSIFEYAKDGRWTKPFPQHDMGTYPQANGQTYTGDMPVEEGGNMLTLAAEICRIEGNTNYVKPYWDLLKTWADYLAENGQDPVNQLCTDDFAGHWAHNANLSAKAIMGVAAYGILCKLDGRAQDAEKYLATAKKMAEQWKKDAADGDHYRLAFDRPDTWSQKYNLVWDKLWGLNMFDDVMEKEINYYLKKQNVYGLPLDCRKGYTKSDWILWTACMAKDNETFKKFVSPVYKFYSETTSRVPMSDWFETEKPVWVSFRARSVIGGFWFKVLMDKNDNK